MSEEAHNDDLIEVQEADAKEVIDLEEQPVQIIQQDSPSKEINVEEMGSGISPIKEFEHGKSPLYQPSPNFE